MSFFVSVAVEKTSFCFDKLFSYRVDESLASKINIGCFVAVPFGKNNELRQAVVIELLQKANQGHGLAAKVKSIAEVLSSESAVSFELFKVVKFLHETCFCTWFDAFRTVLPSGLFFKKQTLWNFKINSIDNLSEPAKILIEVLQNFEKKLSKAEFSKQISDLFSQNRLNDVVCFLKAQGFVFEDEKNFQQKVSSQSLELKEEQNVLFSFTKKLLKSAAFGKKISELVLKKLVNDAVCSLKAGGFVFKAEKFQRRVGLERLENVCITGLSFENLKLTEKQSALFNFIKKLGVVNAKEACYRCGVSAFVLNKLKSMNLIKFCESSFVSNNAEAGLETGHGKGEKNERKPVCLTSEQERAFKGLAQLLVCEKPCVALLRGVTGSGKTQVFLKLIDFVIAKGKQTILLVPEIVLTSQVVRFFKNSFGDMVAVLNSSLTPAQQLKEHKKIKKGVAKIVIGTRSAVFAPCENLGLIIMDEEGVLTYKNSENGPHYHAREVAKFRCLNFKALLVLASATPSIETQYFAKTGRYFEFVLTKRFGLAVLPKVFVVDLKKAEASPIEGISLPFYDELVKNLKKKEQSIVLLNRRGHNSSVVCLNCGSRAMCPNCSAFLTYHSANRSLVCHYCGFISSIVFVCKNCSSSELVYFGQGTQKIEHDFLHHFSSARILRLDSDSTFSRVDLAKKIEDFEQGKYDILIGTQIVAKGLNFLNVTLVGVVAIDNMIYSGDFRSGEQMFSLLTQVIGRSGRGEKRGRAFVQTFNPNSSIILKAASQNYESFYGDEILERKQFLCPPFCDLCVVNFSGFSREHIWSCAKKFVLECRKAAVAEVPVKVLGISTPFIEKLNKRYRNRVIIKCRNGALFRNWIRKIVLNVFASKSFSRIRFNIDINGEIM